MSEPVASAYDVKKKEEQLLHVMEYIVKEVKRRGMDACEIDTSNGVGLSTSVRMRDVESVVFDNYEHISLRVYRGKSRGESSTTDLSTSSVDQAIAAACDIARYTHEDSCSGLARADQMAQKIIDLDLYHPWDIDAEKSIKMAQECEQYGFDFSDKISNSEGATVRTYQGAIGYANSHGFVACFAGTQHMINSSFIAKQGEEMERGFWYSFARDPKHLESLEIIGKNAAKESVSMLGARKVKTGKYPVLFHRQIASSIVKHLLSALNGRLLYRDISFLKDSLGKKVLPDWACIYELPYERGGYASSCFDMDGVQTREQHFIKNGIVENYILAVYQARKLGMETTANAGGCRNVYMESNYTGGLEALMQEMGTGFLVTDFIGSSISLVNGDYSRGASGFWVENGAIAHPVSELTIAGNLKDIFLNIKYMGNDIDQRKNVKTGSILVEEMMVAGD